ncbi:kinase-like protein [Ceratobasidium sp. AG-I]|nr:kinase-like protein [Ceratobasidium sp. AG-I]
MPYYDHPTLCVVPPEAKPHKACADNTRTHVLSVIDSWLRSSTSSKVLSLIDISGSGKSAVAQHVAWIYRRQLICSFFFRQDIVTQSNTIDVVSNFARDLARLGSAIAADIADASKSVQNASYLQSFHAQITTPLCNHPPEQPCLILIDALDESGPLSLRAEFLSVLAHEIPLLPPTVKVMITSRNEHDINDTLDTLSSSGSEDTGVYRLTFDVLGEENKQDLRAYIAQTFEEITRRKRAEGLKLPETWPSYQQLKKLVNHAHGLFLWAKTAAQCVSHSTDAQGALDELLSLESRASSEAAIDVLYKHILHTAESSPYFDLEIYHSVIKLVLTSPNPTIDVVNQALGRDASATIACLMPVLDVRSDSIRIAHQSFREYVTDSQKCDRRFLVWDEKPTINNFRGERSAHGGNLYQGFPLHCLASAVRYPDAPHAAPDVSRLIDPTSVSQFPIARGNFGDIWRAKYTNGMDIVIKSVRIYESESRDKLQRDSVKEMKIWSELDHPNVLRLLGICVFDGEFAMITELMPNETVTKYVIKNPGMNRLPLIIDITEGLSYLHRIGIIHGDLKGGNVVVSVQGTCLLIDFGLARLTTKSLGTSITSKLSGTARWMPYELFDPDEGPNAISTSFSDVYALGMTMLEILTGKMPFSEYISDIQHMSAVMKGCLPRRPSTESAPQLGDCMWELMNECWRRDPKLRPSTTQVLDRLKLIRNG